MKKLVLTLIISVCALAAFAQVPTQRNCGTMLHHEYLKQTRKNYEAELNQYNHMIDQYLQDQAAGLNVNRSSAAIVTIPVVVHIVYNGAAENISDAQAISQVQVLNDDFAKLNADRIKVTQPTFSTVASGAQIRFCLAQRDPNGNPTTGIIRKPTTVGSFGTNDAVKSNASGGDDPWDVTKYVNIWVCDLTGTLLGYGEFPTGTLSNTWGLVIDYAYTGSGGSAQAPFNLGRTGTHEFGHCFNLFHIWGDDNGACSGSDQCADTPNQADASAGAFPQGSIQTDACSPSSPGYMWMNYMDYTDDGSMYMFTAQQVARMEAVVNNPPWNVLGTSLGCTPVNALDARIVNIINPFPGSSTCNNNVTPRVTLSNAGSSTLTSARVLYRMDATTTQTLNWTGSLATGASTILTLNAYTGLTTAAHTFSVWSSLPNGNTDQNTTNDSQSSTFTVIAAPAAVGLPFTEGFEAVTFPPTNWALQKSNTIDPAVSWTRVANTTGLTAGSTAVARMDNYSSNSDIHGQIDALRSPALTFTAATTSSINLSFDVSHRPYATTNYIDTLNVYISTDCGGSWTKLYTKGGAQLSTAVGTQTTAFTPTANAQWRRETINLGAYASQPSVYVKFESMSGYGNHLYLDNINITYTASASPPVASFTSSATKCAGSPITFTDQSTNSPTSWTWNFPGATPSTSTAQNPSVTYTAAGTYTVTHTAANSSGTSTPVAQTITVNPRPTLTVTSVTICSGTTGTITASGASTYLWSTGAAVASLTASPTSLTVYTVTGTSALGCTNTATGTMSVNTTPTVAVNNATICSGNAAALTASGATTYSWSTGASTASVSVSPTITTIYTVTGTSSGCSNTRTVSVTVNTTPTVAVNNATVCTGNAVTLTASGATTYSWSTSATTASISVSPTTTTVYTVTGTSSGCSNTRTVSVTANTTPTVAVSNATICSGNSAGLSASGATTYSWSTGATTASISVTPTATIVYTVTGTSAGCSNTRTVSVTVRTTPTVAVSNTTSCSGNAVTLTASGATTYSWSTSATTSTISVSPSSTTNYTVTGTTNGCSAVRVVTVTVATTPTANAGSSQTLTCASPTVSLNGSGVTTYTWSGPGIVSGANTANPVVGSAGTYTLTGSSSGCTSAPVTVVVSSSAGLPSVASSASGTITCLVTSVNAMVSTTATPVSYSWSGTGITSGASTATITVNQGGVFNYTVTNTSNGCSSTGSQMVAADVTAPTVSVNSETICSGSSATLTATGSSATYGWNTGATGANLTVSPTADTGYTVTATGSNGCTATATTSVIVTSAPVITVNSSSICAGSSTTLTASGVTSYTWDTSSNAASITVSPGSTTVYTVSGTLAGCPTTAVSTATVTVNTPPVVSLGAISGPLCVNSNTVALSGSPSGGTYSGPGVTGSVFDPAAAGAGTITITYDYTDANNCSGSDNQSVVVDLCTGIAELNGTTISVYPNPTRDALHVKLDASFVDKAVIELYDGIGKLVVKEKATDTITTFSMAPLARGVYSIRVVSNSDHKVITIVKE